MNKQEQMTQSVNTFANMITLIAGVAVKVGGDAMAESKDATDNVEELIGSKIQKKLAPYGE